MAGRIPQKEKKPVTRQQTKKSSTSEVGESTIVDLENGASDTSTQINCCIYSVPKKLVEISGQKWFEPCVVSIGHYNCKDDAKHKGLQVIQEHKQEFCNILKSHAKKKNMEELMDIIRPAVEKIGFEFKSNKNDTFLKMLVLDGCFILELFRILGKERPLESDDPSNHLISSVAWAIPYFYGDLLLLENQIPFVVLKKLFKNSKMPDENYPLSFLALRFFNKVMRRSDEELRKMSMMNENLKNSLHLLELVQKSFITPDLYQPPKGKNSETVPVIHCITKLLKAGIKIKLREADSFLDVKFNNGVIEMPKITFDYFMRSFLVNCRAFEQLSKKGSEHITVYAYFLDCLVDTSMDVEYLYERNIIDSNVRKDGDVVQFINKLGKEKEVATDQFYLYKFFNDVNRHYKNTYSVLITGIEDAETFHDLESGASYDTSTQNCCIYRVPGTIREINGKKWYEPRVVSIGHYHYNKHERLQVIQKHKWKYYSILVSKAQKSLNELMEIMRPLEAQARGFYSEKIEFESDMEDDKFLKMLILDGCFILELFRILGKERQLESNDLSDHPISSVA